MDALGVLRCEELLLDIDSQLVVLMQGAAQEDWNRPTIFPEWRVRDIFSHMLDTSIRKLSMQRDYYFDTSRKVEVHNNQELTEFVTQLADEWAFATRRISPAILLTLFDRIKDDLYSFISSQDPHSTAMFSVSWAGESESKVWFDNAREYTEHWVHQQQIRDALNAPPLYSRKYLHPLNDILLRALPHTFLQLARPEGFSFNLEITGDAGDHYCLLKEGENWRLYRGAAITPDSTVWVKDQILWKILTKNTARDEKLLQIEGDEETARLLLSTTSMLI